MKILSVTKRERIDGPSVPFVRIEAAIGTSGDSFELDLNGVGNLLKRVVPFERVLVGDHMIPGFDAGDIFGRLVRATGIRMNSIEVGNKDGLRYSLGISGLADAWKTVESGERRHLWNLFGSILTGPIPRDSKSGAPRPLVLSVIVETTHGHYDHRLRTVAVGTRGALRSAGYDIEAALVNANRRVA